MELCLEGAPKCCSVLGNKKKSLKHNSDCALEQENRHLPSPAVMLGRELEHRLHYTVLISLNKGF